MHLFPRAGGGERGAAGADAEQEPHRGAPAACQPGPQQLTCS